jgi:hypothetical protein
MEASWALMIQHYHDLRLAAWVDPCFPYAYRLVLMVCAAAKVWGFLSYFACIYKEMLIIPQTLALPRISLSWILTGVRKRWPVGNLTSLDSSQRKTLDSVPQLCCHLLLAIGCSNPHIISTVGYVARMPFLD